MLISYVRRYRTALSKLCHCTSKLSSC